MLSEEDNHRLEEGRKQHIMRRGINRMRNMSLHASMQTWNSFALERVRERNVLGRASVRCVKSAS
jgi:hypothetical protein